MNEFGQRTISVAGAQESLVRHFSVEGLFGYKTLSINSEHAATIVIANNGAGKTTVLGALDAFLKGQFGRLAELNFKQIVCELRNIDEKLVLQKSDLDYFLKNSSENVAVQRAAKQHELEAEELLFFCLWDFPLLPMIERLYTKILFIARYSVSRLTPLIQPKN